MHRVEGLRKGCVEALMESYSIGKSSQQDPPRVYTDYSTRWQTGNFVVRWANHECISSMVHTEHMRLPHVVQLNQSSNNTSILERHPPIRHKYAAELR